MAKEGETVVEEQTQTTDSQGQSAEQTTATEEKGGTTETPKEEAVETVDIADIKKVDGKYVYTDPDNPEGTTYQGDSIADVFKQMAKGNREKDGYIATLKAKQVQIPTVEEIEAGIEQDAEPEFVDETDVLLTVAKKRGLDPNVLTMSDDKWREMEAQQGVRAVNRLDNLMQAVRQEAQRIAAASNLKVMNKTVVKEQHATIREMLAEENVDADSISLKSFFKEELENPKNYKNGLLKSGVLVARAHKEISKVQKASLESTTKKKVETEIAAGKKEKKEAASDGSSTGSSGKVQKAPPKNMDEVHARAMEYFNR